MLLGDFTVKQEKKQWNGPENDAVSCTKIRGQGFKYLLFFSKRIFGPAAKTVRSPINNSHTQSDRKLSCCCLGQRNVKTRPRSRLQENP